MMSSSGAPPAGGAARPHTVRTAHDKQPTVDPALSSAVLLLRRGKLDEAVLAFKAILAREPRNELAFCNLGIALMQLGRWREAGIAVLAYLKLEPEDAKGHVRLGVIQNEMKATDQAIRSFQNALRWDKNCSEAYRYLGETYLAMGRLDDARDGFKWAIRLRPSDMGSACGLAEIYERKDMAGVAVKLLLDAVRRARPADAGPVYVNLGRLLAKDGQWGPALDAYNKALAFGIDDDQSLYDLAAAALKAGKPDLARTQLAELESRKSPLARGLRKLLAK